MFTFRGLVCAAVGGMTGSVRRSSKRVFAPLFLLAAEAASQRTSMSPKCINTLEECQKYGHSSHRFEMTDSGIMMVCMKGLIKDE